MSSRGKQLVQLALEKIREREMPVTVDRNNNIEEDFSDEEFESGVLPTTVQDFNKIEKQRANVALEQTMVSSLDMYRIQGTSITNVESVIRDNEDDDNRDSNHEEDCVDRSLHNNESDNDNTSESEISSNNFDSDDSFKDPDWKEEIYRKRNKCTNSSDYDSDISISNNPYTSSKRKRKQNYENQSSAGNSEVQESQNNDFRKTEVQANESETFVAYQMIDIGADNLTDNETSLAVNMIATDHDNDKKSEVNTQELDIAREVEITTEDANQSDGKQKHPRTKKGMGSPNNWKKNINKKLRMEGKAYKGLKETDGKKTYSVDKKARIQGERSCGKRCERVRGCIEISDILRKEIFDSFWYNMDWNHKSLFVAGLVCRTEVNSSIGKGKKRKIVEESIVSDTDGEKDVKSDSRTRGSTHEDEIIAPKRRSEENSTAKGRRKYTYIYHFRIGERKVRVCKEFFLSTLGIREHMVYDWLDRNTDSNGLPQPKAVSKRTPPLTRISTEWKNAEAFLDSLPKMESHYCKASTSKIYLEPVFVSFADLMRVYEKHCRDHGYNSIGRMSLNRIFDQKNLSLFKPKKDQCDICVGHSHGSVSDENYNIHITCKNEARMYKDNEKQRASDKVKVITMDVQAVLLSPRIEASAVYYKTKLASHNFTLYDLGTKDVKCYFWHEGEGGLTANSFATCINDYLKGTLIKPGVEEIVLFSDGCCYQNRNATLSNTLLRLAVHYNIVITQNVLEKGHTQMEVDSTHSIIERRLKKRPIYAPTNYVEVMRSVREQHPFIVEYVDHTFFKNYSCLKFYDTIRPGIKVGDPVVTDIRSLKYKPEGVIQYKVSYADEYKDLPKRRNATVPTGREVIPPLYTGPLQIKKSKYEHLQQLKAVIPKDYHPFYDTLKH